MKIGVVVIFSCEIQIKISKYIHRFIENGSKQNMIIYSFMNNFVKVCRFWST